MALLLFLFWLVLNGRLTLEIILLGGAVTALAMLFLCTCCDWNLKKEGKLYRAAPWALLYALTVIREIILANLRMLPIVFSGKPEPVVRRVRTRLKTRIAKAVLSNSITLTPGTITLSLEGDELIVHCLTKKMAEGLEDSVFEKRLISMEEKLYG